jgi:hypothetical protein
VGIAWLRRIVQDTQAGMLNAGIDDFVKNLHELRIEDEIAQAYLVASYGRHVRVKDAEALRSVAQGLTMNGMASGGFRMFTTWIDDGELAFGGEARRKRAAGLAREIRNKQEEITRLKTKAGELAA